MSTTTPPQKKTVETDRVGPDGRVANALEELADRLTRSFTVGTDAEGYDHHYYRPADAVVRYDPRTREVERVRYLDGALLADWVQFVDKEVGWDLKGPHADRGIAEDRRRKEGL